jgi:phage gp29-like protein
VAKPNQKAAPGRAGSQAALIANINRWRDQYNPLRSLNMARAIQLLEMGDRGEFADLQWLYHFIEKRDATCRSLIKRRRAALLKRDWDIRLVSELPLGTTQTQAENQRQTLRTAYERLDNIPDAIKHLALAEFRGYSHLQKHRDASGEVTHLEPLDHWNWVRDGLRGDWYWNPESRATSASGLQGNQIDRSEFIIREEDMPVDEIALVCFLRKNLSQKDWDAFGEIYGVPGGVVTMPPNIPAGKETDYEDAATKIAEGGSGALPHGSTYQANDSPRGVNPFRDHLRHQDEILVLAGTSGKLTMLTEAGSGTLAGGAHQDAFDDITEGEASELNGIFQKQFDAEVLKRHHPGEPVLAYFQLCVKDATDVGKLADNAVKFHQAGFEMDPEELSEKSGYKVTRPEVVAALNADPTGSAPGADASASAAAGPSFAGPTEGRALKNRDANGKSKAQGSNVQSPIQTPEIETGDDAIQQLGMAHAEDLQPIRERLAAIMRISDPALLRSKLAAFKAQLPGLLRDINADPAAALVLADQMQGAFAQGVTSNQ